jgi:hypothetical protein
LTNGQFVYLPSGIVWSFIPAQQKGIRETITVHEIEIAICEAVAAEREHRSFLLSDSVDVEAIPVLPHAGDRERMLWFNIHSLFWAEFLLIYIIKN